MDISSNPRAARGRSADRLRILCACLALLAGTAGAKGRPRPHLTVVYGCRTCTYELRSQGRSIVPVKEPFLGGMDLWRFRYEAVTDRATVRACHGDSCRTARVGECETADDTCRAALTLRPDLEFGKGPTRP